MDISDWIARTIRARYAAHHALAGHESSASRVILLEDLLKRLSGTPVDVQDYFREAIFCLEKRLYRSAIVVSWAGFFHVFSDKLFDKHETDIRSARPKWVAKEITELRDTKSDSDILEVAKDVAFISRPILRIYNGQLSQRNQCAHPTLYRPNMNIAIGYVDSMINQTIQCLDA